MIVFYNAPRSVTEYSAWVRPWLSEYHTSEVPGLDGPWRIPEVGRFDSYGDDVEGKGGWDFLDSTPGPCLGHLVSTHASYDQLQEVWSTSNFSLPKSVFDLLRLDVRSVWPYLIFILLTRVLVHLRPHRKPVTSKSVFWSRKMCQMVPTLFRRRHRLTA